MSKRYAIWDKKSPIVTPIGEVFTPEQWINKYPVAGIEGVTVVCAAGIFSGGYFGVLEGMMQMYGQNGADFSACTTAEEALEVIEAFEDEMNKPTHESTPEERIAAALEYNNLLNTEVVNTDDPDAE